LGQLPNTQKNYYFLWEFCLFDYQRTLNPMLTGSRQAKLLAAHRHEAFLLRGGGEGIRTPDPMVANHVLCQLSYTPVTRLTAFNLVGLGGFELPTSPLSGVRSNQLSYRPAGLLPQNKGYKFSPVASFGLQHRACNQNLKRTKTSIFQN
jgi:hypothetical protein